MAASQTLPKTYREIWTLDITKDQRLVLYLNLAGFILLLGFGWLFFRAILWLRPAEVFTEVKFATQSIFELLATILAVLLLTAFHVVIHEALHGIFFWLFTRSRPKFAIRLYYAYAAAPGWYIPRNAFLITTLAPLVLISLVSLLFLRLVPPAWLLAVWYVASMNAAGSVGDLLVTFWMLRQPPRALAQDFGDRVTLYLPTSESIQDTQ